MCGYVLAFTLALRILQVDQSGNTGCAKPGTSEISGVIASPAIAARSEYRNHRSLPGANRSSLPCRRHHAANQRCSLWGESQGHDTA